MSALKRKVLRRIARRHEQASRAIMAAKKLGATQEEIGSAIRDGGKAAMRRD
jgi:alkylhydroperoxidase/carboxymuconolactone decarboxylase family protein YurZ